jgi:two-component system nitrate/nitrite response regulator NarL
MANADATVRIARALASGFQGIAIRDQSLNGFLTAVETALRNDPRTPNRHRLARESRPSRPVTPETLLLGQLTARELDVLRLLVEGLTSGRIAGELGISSNTVRSHIQSVLHKLHVHSRLEAAAFAVRHELFRQPWPVRHGEAREIVGDLTGPSATTDIHPPHPHDVDGIRRSSRVSREVPA